MGPVFAVRAPRSALVLESASKRASSRRSGQPLGIGRRRPAGSIGASAQNESARRTFARWRAGWSALDRAGGNSTAWFDSSRKDTHWGRRKLKTSKEVGDVYQGVRDGRTFRHSF